MTYLGSVRSPRVVNIADLRRLAKRRLPRLVFDYIDGGAEDEITLRDNVRAFREVRFRLRQGVAVSECDLRTTVLGTTYALPFLLAPVGFSRMFYPRGEAVAARAASAAGTAFILSTFSGTPPRGNPRAGRRPALVSALRARRPRGRGSQHGARACGRLLGARRHDRYARLRHA